MTKRHPTSVVSQPANKSADDAASRGPPCGKECESLRERLRIAEMRLAEEMNIKNIPEDSNKVSNE